MSEKILRKNYLRSTTFRVPGFAAESQRTPDEKLEKNILRTFLPVNAKNTVTFIFSDFTNQQGFYRDFG